MAKICEVSNASGADVFVSIHNNAAASTSARGMETFYYAGYAEDKKLATCIQNQLVKNINSIDRGVKTASYYVLTYNDAPKAAVLVECAFITNKQDNFLLKDKTDNFARAIAVGISDYFVK